MKKIHFRTLGSQFTAAVVGVLATALVMGGGLAFAQGAPASGAGVAEAIAAPNTVNSSSIVNGSVARADMKPGSLPSWAKVGGGTAGTLLAGRGVVSSTRISAGVYQVVFNRSIIGCGWTATLNDNDAGGATAGQIAVERASSAITTNLIVRTYNTSGAQTDTGADDGFTVMVVC